MAKLTAKQRQMYREFTCEHTFCWACGVEPGQCHLLMSPDYWRHLECAHIIGGSGRVADRRAICRLCKLCHDLNHGCRIVVDGKALPNLKLSHMLWLKHRHDGPVDRKFLTSLSVSAILPRSAPPPKWFKDSYTTIRGVY